MTNRTSFLPFSLNEGLLFGLILSSIYLIMNITGLHTNLILNLVVAVLGIALYFVCGYRAMSKYRREVGMDVITFGDAFLVAFLAIIITTTIYLIVTYAYSFHLNPSSVDQMIDASVEFMEWAGTPDDAIDKQIEVMEMSMKNPRRFISAGVIGNFAFSLVGGLIVALTRKMRTPNA